MVQMHPRMKMSSFVLWVHYQNSMQTLLELFLILSVTVDHTPEMHPILLHLLQIFCCAPDEQCDKAQDGLGDDGSQNKIKLHNTH